jgi:hypothetical protein
MDLAKNVPTNLKIAHFAIFLQASKLNVQAFWKHVDLQYGK